PLSSPTSSATVLTSSPSTVLAACNRSGERPVITTRAPSPLAASAVARPMPELPPTMTTVLLIRDTFNHLLGLPWREIHLAQQQLVAWVVLEFTKGGEVGKPKQIGVPLVRCFAERLEHSIGFPKV